MSAPVDAASAARSVYRVSGPNKEPGSARDFRPLPLLANAHVQTIAAMFWPQRGERHPSAHQLVELPDGDKLVIVISTPPQWVP